MTWCIIQVINLPWCMIEGMNVRKKGKSIKRIFKHDLHERRLMNTYSTCSNRKTSRPARVYQLMNLWNIWLFTFSRLFFNSHEIYSSKTANKNVRWEKFNWTVIYICESYLLWNVIFLFSGPYKCSLLTKPTQCNFRLGTGPF